MTVNPILRTTQLTTKLFVIDSTTDLPTNSFIGSCIDSLYNKCIAIDICSCAPVKAMKF